MDALTWHPAPDDLWLEDVMKRCRSAMHNRGYNVLGDPWDVEDALQELWMRLWLHRGTVRPGEESAWSRTTLTRLAIDMMRTPYHRNRKKAVWLDQLMTVDGFDPLEAVRTWGDGAAHLGTPTLEETWVRQAFAPELRVAIGRLTPNYRDVVECYYFQNMSYKEIEAHLRIPLGTVKSWLNHAKKRLREILADMGVTAEDVSH